MVQSLPTTLSRQGRKLARGRQTFVHGSCSTCCKYGMLQVRNVLFENCQVFASVAVSWHILACFALRAHRRTRTTRSFSSWRRLPQATAWATAGAGGPARLSRRPARSEPPPVLLGVERPLPRSQTAHVQPLFTASWEHLHASRDDIQG